LNRIADERIMERIIQEKPKGPEIEEYFGKDGICMLNQNKNGLYETR
jgi:hypothetical protein